MSHFTVMVFGNDPEEQLAPFQENNMGDCPMQYMEFEDFTEELQKEWETGKTERFVDSSGTMFAPWDCEAHEVKGNKRVPKEGFVEKVVAYKDMYESIDQFARDWHGYTKHGNRYGYYHNPNSKWDWYVLGGRWRGHFKVKTIGQLKLNTPLLEGPVAGLVPSELQVLVKLYNTDKNRFEEVVSKYNGYDGDIRKAVEQLAEGADGDVIEDILAPHIVGESGAFGNEAREGYADQLLKKYIDVDGMVKDASERAAARYDRILKIITDVPHWKPVLNWKPWQYFLDKYPEDIDTARKKYHGQAKLERIKKVLWEEDQTHLWEPDDFLVPRKEYIERCGALSLTPHAFIKDGQWTEQGEMGWFACVSNEKDTDDWIMEFYNMFKELPDDILVSVFDCHI